MEKWQKAYNDYQKGLKYSEIADKYGVSVNTVKSWKVRFWNKEKENLCAYKSQKSVHTKKSGAPEGNTNNLKHGLFAKINMRTLTEEEREYLLNGKIDAGKELEMMSRLSDIRNARLFEKMTETEKASKGLVLGGMTAIKTKGRKNDGEEKTEISFNSADEMLIKYNDAIIKNDRLKIKCIEMLSNLESEKTYSTDEKVKIYIPDNERKSK